MLKVDIEGRPYLFPQKWSEVSVHVFTELQKFRQQGRGAVNPPRLLSILSGLDYSTLINADCSLFETEIMPCLDFIGEDITLDQLERPSFIHIDGEPYEVPSRPEFTFGQKYFLHEKANEALKENTPIIQLASFVLATYYQPIVEKAPYDDKRAKDFERRVRWCSVVEAYPVTAFFLNSSVGLLKQRPENSNSHPPSSKNLPELRSSKASGFWARLTRWPKGTR